MIILLTLAFCGGQKSEWQGTIEEIDGLVIVKNPKEPMIQGDIFTLEEDLSIGQIDGTEDYIKIGNMMM